MTRAGDRLGVAVSGGADSVALVRLLLELRAELGIVLSVVHFNHKIRGDAADADEQFVRELADTHGLELHVSSADTPTHAKEKKMSLEAAARELRYGYFESLMRSGVVNKVATAHTLDDQAETVLLRIVRGTGTAGLAGIEPKLRVWGSLANGEIIRPLLAVSRSDVETFIRHLGQPWSEDSTNSDTTFTRNRVRHVLLPLLEREFNPAVRERLSDLAEIARVEQEHLDSETSGAVLEAIWWGNKLPMPPLGLQPLSTVATNPAPTCPEPEDVANRALDLERLKSLSPAIQRRIIRLYAKRLGSTLELRHVDEVLKHAFAQHSAAELSHLPDGLRVSKKTGWNAAGKRTGSYLLFEIASPAVTAPDYSYALPIPGEVHIPELNSTISARLIDLGADRLKAENMAGEADPAGYNPSQLMDPSTLAPELTVRNWRPGDRFWPAHTATPKKIKELLQQRHVTGEARRRWPVVVSGTEVVWLKDFPVRQGYGVHDDCGVALLIEVRPL